MYAEQWIVFVSVGGGVLFGLAAALHAVRRPHLAFSSGILFLLAWYEMRMDRWEKTVSAPIRLDILVEIPLMILCLIFGVWQIVLGRKRKAL